jgi:deoxyadenosine/deoxycytidine kinase
MNQPFYLAIEGVIGVGKTTLARLLQPRFDAELILEIFEENPFLPKFYTDREGFAFRTQAFFLDSRYKQQKEIKRNNKSLIADYILDKDRIFACLNLTGDELEMYNRFYKSLAETIVKPDLVVYLRASHEVLMARIASRDRPYERGMDPDYIRSLHQAYENYFENYDDTPLLTIETDEINYVLNPEHLSYIEGQIRTALSAAEIQAQNPHLRNIKPEERMLQSPVLEEYLALTEATINLGTALSNYQEMISLEMEKAFNVLATRTECLGRVLKEKKLENEKYTSNLKSTTSHQAFLRQASLLTTK